VLKVSLVWEAAGIVFAAFAYPALAIVAELFFDPQPVGLWIARYQLGVFWSAVSAILMSPLTLTAFYVWGRLARRGILERSGPEFTVGLLILSGVLALLAGMISSWERLGQTEYWSESLVIAMSVLPGVLIGVILPRWLVRPLRRGCFVLEAAT
jgi:hypothetical protein